ncbi:hypothetical protein BH10PSE12_BH10PSE12_10330 [soil metagenome]
MGALVHLHRQGKALYVGLSSYSPDLTRQAAAIMKSEGVPLPIHQPSYSLLNRWIEEATPVVHVLCPAAQPGGGDGERIIGQSDRDRLSLYGSGGSVRKTNYLTPITQTID